MSKGKFYYVIGNNGDGSAKAYFYADETTAMKAFKIEEKSGEGFTDNEPREVALEFNDEGKLLNPSDVIEDYS